MHPMFSLEPHAMPTCTWYHLHDLAEKRINQSKITRQYTFLLNSLNRDFGWTERLLSGKQCKCWGCRRHHEAQWEWLRAQCIILPARESSVITHSQQSYHQKSRRGPTSRLIPPSSVILRCAFRADVVHPVASTLQQRKRAAKYLKHNTLRPWSFRPASLSVLRASSKDLVMVDELAAKTWMPF